MIRVVIADDHKLVRKGLRAILLQDRDIQVVGEACDGQEAVTLARQLAPDIILMDIQMPGLDGLEATLAICNEHREIHVLIVAMSSDERFVKRALRNGALGYVAKQEIAEELIPAIRALQEGKTYLSHTVSKRASGDGREAQ